MIMLFFLSLFVHGAYVQQDNSSMKIVFSEKSFKNYPVKEKDVGNIQKCFSFGKKIYVLTGENLVQIGEKEEISHPVSDCIAVDYRYVYTYKDKQLKVFDIGSMEMVYKFDIDLEMIQRTRNDYSYPVAIVDNDLYYLVDKKMHRLNIQTGEKDELTFEYNQIFPFPGGCVFELSPGFFAIKMEGKGVRWFIVPLRDYWAPVVYSFNWDHEGCYFNYLFLEYRYYEKLGPRELKHENFFYDFKTFEVKKIDEIPYGENIRYYLYLEDTSKLKEVKQ